MSLAAGSIGRLPTGRVGQAVAVALLLLVLVLGWAAAAAPLLDWYAERGEALLRREVLARRMAQVAATLPQLQAQAATAGTSGPGASGPGASGPGGSGPGALALLAGGSDAVAGAALQQTLQEMAAQAGTALSSTESLPPQQVGTVRLIAVQVAVNAPWPNLVRLLQLVDTARPQMLVDDLQVHGSAGFIRRADAPLEASFTVMGFRAGTGAGAR